MTRRDGNADPDWVDALADPLSGPIAFRHATVLLPRTERARQRFDNGLAPRHNLQSIIKTY